MLILNFACKIAATADNLGQRATHAEPWHWSEGRHNNVGVSAGKATHESSNTRGVTAGKMGCNSSKYNNIRFINTWWLTEEILYEESIGKAGFVWYYLLKLKRQKMSLPKNI